MRVASESDRQAAGQSLVPSDQAQSIATDDSQPSQTPSILHSDRLANPTAFLLRILAVQRSRAARPEPPSRVSPVPIPETRQPRHECRHPPDCGSPSTGPPSRQEGVRAARPNIRRRCEWRRGPAPCRPPCRRAGSRRASGPAPSLEPVCFRRGRRHSADPRSLFSNHEAQRSRPL